MIVLRRSRPMIATALVSALMSPDVRADAAPDERLLALAQRERPAVVETLRELVSIESGSRDREGLDRLAAALRDRLQALGGTVEIVNHGAEVIRFHDTPPAPGATVVGRFDGTGQRSVMLLAHMDTVYPRGTLARRPFRVEGTRAYGPGTADDKGGIAILLHALGILREIGFHDYRRLTVVINGDEELSTPAARGLIARLGAEHEFVFSCEPTSGSRPGHPLAVATSGVASATLTVHGRASHAGSAPEKGRNALIELAHQIIATRGLGDPARGISLTWTMANAGTTRNTVPDLATAAADIRVRQAADFDAIEQAIRERIEQERLVPDTRIEFAFERRRPPLEMTARSAAVARKAQAIYAEIGRTLALDESGRGGGTDAAFAAESGHAAVVEGFGLAGFNYHSADEESVDLESIEPRLYLLLRLLVEVSRDG